VQAAQPRCHDFGEALRPRVVRENRGRAHGEHGRDVGSVGQQEVD
jgi:hypothetical protein